MAERRTTKAEIAELIVDNARDFAMFVMNDAGDILTWSPGAQAVFGYSEDEAIGMSGKALFVAADLATGAADLELELAREKGRAEDSRWHLRKDGARFWGNGVTMRLTEEPGPGFVKVVRDETRSKLADEQRILLLNELNHRVKNTLATVQSIAEQTLRGANVAENIRQNLGKRLLALSQAHDVLVRENWAGADLHEIIAEALAPHRHDRNPAFHVDGPPVRLNAQQAVSLSLLLHELLTNALKYGALTGHDGKVQITWNAAIDGHGRRYMSLLWVETDGPPVELPTRTGFGTRLISRTFAAEDGGQASLSYDPEGVRCAVTMLLSRPEEIPTSDG